MKILVPCKRVPDPDQKLRLNAEAVGIDSNALTYILNPFDAIAVEEALRIRETAHLDAEVIAVSIAPAEGEADLRTALAMGADRALLIEHNGPSDPWNVARLLAAVIEHEQPTLVLMGKQAVDDDANQTGQLLASTLDWPQATFASKVEFSDDKSEVSVTREVDGGLETIAFNLPGIVTTDLRLNEPRYASLPGIMKARKKELKEIPLAEAGASDSLQVETLNLVPPAVREAGKTVETVEELVELLHSEAKLI